MKSKNKIRLDDLLVEREVSKNLDQARKNIWSGKVKLLNTDYKVLAPHIIVDSNSGPFPYIGFITSFIIGYISLKLLISIIYKEKLWYFSIYCFIIGLGAIFLF